MVPKREKAAMNNNDLRHLPPLASLPGSLGGLPHQVGGAEGGTTSPDPFDRPTDHYSEQIAEYEATYGVDALGNKFGVNDSVELIDGSVVRVVGIRGDRFSYWDSRIPLGLVSHPSMAVVKAAV